MDRKKTLILLHLLFILFFANGCFITFYPAKVAKKGEQFIGFGVVTEKTSQSVSIYGWRPCNSLFFRHGIFNKTDIGISIKNIYLYPQLTMSIRKQFDFKSNIINAMTIDIGCGVGSGYRSYRFINSSIISNDFAITFGFGGTYYLLGLNPYFYNFSTKISYEIKIGKISIMPFICYESNQKYDEGNFITLLSPKLYLTEEENWQTKSFGLGVSVYYSMNL